VTGAEVGTAVVAYIEPHPGHAVDFNRWYERDHFPAAVMAGPGVFAGARFVATRACKALRRGTRFGDPARGSYLAVAWLLPGTQAGWDTWVKGAVDALAAAGRTFPHRDHLHTAVYACTREQRSGDDVPPAAQALDHPFPGVVVVAAGAGVADALARDLVGPAVPVAVVLDPQRLVVSVLERAAESFDDHALVLGFVAGDVLETWATDVEPALARLGAPVAFASPFLRTVPGTDTYADDL
jgi:hypothetical protein